MTATALATVLLLVVAFTTSLVLTPLVRNFARDRGWFDRPDGRRKTHRAPVPRLGGVAVYGAFVLASGLLLVIDPFGSSRGAPGAADYLHLMVACGAVMLIGLGDDIFEIGPAAKIAVQTAAAAYLFLNGYRISAISNPLGGEALSLGVLSLPLTVVWFVGMSNAFNLIDGLDGLAAGIGLFSTTTLFIASAINGRWEVVFLATALGGALLGFLRYNFAPASIFLGDSGSLFVGFALAAIAVRGSMKSSAAIAVVAPLLALAVPLVDAAIAILRRLISGRRLFEADGDHIHHRMIRKGFTPRGAVVALYGVAAVFGALSLLTMTGRGQVVGLVVIASSVVTWIGVQQLGYSEFGEVQRVLKQGLFNERQAIGNNVYVLSLRTQLEEAKDLAQLWGDLIGAASRLQFLAVHLDLRPEWQQQVARRDAGAPPAGDFPLWRGAAPADGAPRLTWTVPLASGGETLGVLVLERSLTGGQPQFESTYLLDAFTSGFAPRLKRLLSPAHQASEGGAPQGVDSSDDAARH